MKKKTLFLAIGCLFFSNSVYLSAAKKSLFLPAKIESEFIIYSYDFDLALTAGVKFSAENLLIGANRAWLDFEINAILFFGAVNLQSGTDSLAADQLILDLENSRLIFDNFYPQPERKYYSFSSGRLTPVENQSQKALQPRKINFSRLNSSLIYFTMQKLEVKSDLTPLGINCRLYLEGIPSLSFKKFKLSSGLEELAEKKIFSLEKINYFGKKGLLTKFSFNPFLSSSAGLKTLLEIESSFRPPLKKNDFDLQGNFLFEAKLSNDTNLKAISSYLLNHSWQSEIYFHQEDQNENNSNRRLGFRHFLLINDQSQSWLFFQQTSNSMRRSLNFEFAFSQNEQKILNFHLWHRLPGNFSLTINNRFRQLSIKNKSRNNDFSYQIGYQSGLLSIEQGFLVNKDYYANESARNTTLNIRLHPFQFYSGLLNLNAALNVEFPAFSRKDNESSQQNIFFQIALNSEKLRLSDLTTVKLMLSLENLLSSHRDRAYSGLSWALQFRHSFSRSLSFELNYNYHTRRNPENFFVSGSAVQTLSPRLEIKLLPTFNSDLLLFYDLEAGKLRNIFLSEQLKISAKWSIESRINYDSDLHRALYEVYLLRRSGRFEFCAGYRSISGQFVLELRPLSK